MSCKLDVIGGLAEVQQGVELQLAVSKYGKVQCLFLPPPDLRKFEPGLVVFEEAQSVQAVVEACGEGNIAVRGKLLLCEPHERRGTASSSENGGSNWGKNGDTQVGMRLIGELGEEQTSPPPKGSGKGQKHQRIRRWIKCEDLPKRLKDKFGPSVFVIRSWLPNVRCLHAGTKVSFILEESEKHGNPQTKGEDIQAQEVAWQKRGTGPPRGRHTPKSKPGPRKAGGNDPRLERFIELNHLDDDVEVCKTLRRSHKSLQAAVIDHWEEAGLKIDQSGDRQIDPGAIVMAKLKTEQEKIKQNRQATARSTSRRRSLGGEEDDNDERRSRSRSAACRSRSQESASRSHSRQGAAAESTHEAHQQKHSRPSKSRSRSRGSASRSPTPLKRDSALQTREPQEQAFGTVAALEDEPTGSLLLQLTNLPSLSKGTPVSEYFADMLDPHLRELPDFDSSRGKPICQVWEHGHDSVFMKLQNAVLAASAARVVDGLALFGTVVKASNLSKSEADHAQGNEEPRRQQQAIQDSVPARKVMLRAAE